ncbi:CDP-alcohol phosphatidyltransferase family protein [Sphaerisporangium aureirubrum]|uniref:CDP-alcohol phosphatidyltransferase family protein n=1 Tax=Sphaerisporangium aureirubrum TaxID=1544736 RepID=A0ABW1ND35_9ACTN
MGSYSLDDIRATRKRRDSWWTVFLVDPIACRVTLLVANHTDITPNGLTRLSLVLGMGAAACFATGRLALGALVFYLSFVVDCMDGKIARLKGTGTPFGLWLDYVGDRIRVVCCACGLAYGQYAETGRLAYVLLGAAIAVLDLFRYVNAPQMKRVRRTARARHRAALRAELAAVRDAMAVDWLTQDRGDHAPGPSRPPVAPEPEAVATVRPTARPEFVTLFGPVAVGAVLSHAPPEAWRGAGPAPMAAEPKVGARRRVGGFLAACRVRTHLMSGIEFHAAVFVVAPLAGAEALLPVTVTAGALLVLNEIFLIYRMWQATRAVAARAVRPVPRPAESPRLRTDPFRTGVEIR